MAEASLKEKTAKGLFWGGFSNGMQQLLNLGFGIVLARLLTPADYGMVGMLTIFSLIAGSLQESGFIAALTNKRTVTHRDYNAVFWFSTGMGLCLYTVLFFCAPLIARFYHTPGLTPLARYSFLGFLVSSLGTAQAAYLFRNLKVKQKALVQVTGHVLSGIVGITLAFHGFAYWGIATQSLVYVGVNTLGIWLLSPWRPTLSIDLSPLRGLFAFSSRILLTNIFSHLNNNLFSILLGKFYTEREVGFYNQANKWNYMGHALITSMIGGVAQPIMSRVSDDVARQRRVFRKMLRFTAFISFPLMFGLSFIAPQLIEIAITDKWLESARILQILCLGGSTIPIAVLCSNLVISKGKSDIHLWSTVGQGVVQLSVAILLYPHGIYPMIWAYVAINASWLLVWHHFVRREIHLPLRDALKDVLPYAAIAAACILATRFLTAGIHNLYLLFAAKIAVAAALYIICMWFSRSVTFREVISYLHHKRQ